MARTKKEIDKELMYKKIMPSAVRAAAQEDDEEEDSSPAKLPARGAKNAAQPERFAGAQLDKIAANVRKRVAALSEETLREPLAPHRAPARPTEPTYQPESASELRYAVSGQRPEESRAEHSVSPKSPPLQPPDTVQEAGQPETAEQAEPPEKHLVNQIEQFVEQRLSSVVEKFHCCDCEKCRKDIIAISLNKLKPHYVVLDDKTPAPLVDRQTTAEVTTALIQAALIVKAHPRH